VDAAYIQGSSASVSGGATTIKQGTLTVMVLKNI
jgi:3-hydroxyisobutyrate dehydrogenase-like beta-hydroxyacid dehydrogenase